MQQIEELPPVDERLVAPGTRYEILDGVVMYVPPADPPHAIRHSKVATLVETHAHADFQVACDMLTRTSKIDDFAPDVSVYPRAPDPVTGGRQIEQLVFEIVSTASMATTSRKAEKLAARGVRRIFAIDIERDRALEWSRVLATWSVLSSHGSIEDPALAVPLSIDDLQHAGNTDDAVARALLAKRAPAIVAAWATDRAEGVAQGKAEGIAQGKAEGIAQGRAEAVLAMLVARGLVPRDEERVRILAERDLATLDVWLVRAATCATAAELLAR
jgi:hypothetical protein